MAERQFGPYRLVHQIATGGMAEIHLAKTRGIGGFEKFVALKMIHPNFSSDEHFIEMLIDEAKISVQLQHVNIGQIFDLGRVGDTYYIAMEYVDGCDLYRILRKASELDVPMPIEVAAFIGKEVATGLDYAHRKRDASGKSLGIVHRDISPQNVLLSHAGEVKIVDFGIAKATSRVRQTGVGVIKGKYYYMSPEQAWGDPIDARSDLFSAGILIYEMLVGQMLYLEEDLHKLLDMVRKADIPPPSTKRREVPRALDQIVMKALAKKPEQRWQSAHDFTTALESFLHGYAPDFTPQRLASFVNTVLNEVTPPPVSVEALAPKPVPPAPSRRVTKGLGRDAIMSRAEFTDENSVIFRLADVARKDRGGPGVAEERAAQSPNVIGRVKPRAASAPVAAAPASPTAPAKRPPSAAPVPAARPSARAPNPRMPDAATPHIPATENFDDQTQISDPPGFGGGAAFDDEEITRMPAEPFEDPAADPPDPEDMSWDRDADFASHQPTRAEGPASRMAVPRAMLSGKSKLPAVMQPAAAPARPVDDEDAPTGTHRVPPPSGAVMFEDDVEDNPTQRLKGMGPLPPGAGPPALSATSPKPAISALSQPARSRRTPAAVPILPPQITAPPPVPPAPAPSPALSPAHASANGVPQLPLSAPPSVGPPAAASKPPRPRAASEPPVPLIMPTSVAPLWPREDGALPDIDDPSLRISGSRPKKMWALLGILVALVGLGAIAIALTSRSGEPRATLGSMEVISLPPGATVSIDGRAAGATPLTVEDLPVGKTVRLRLEMNRHDIWEREEKVTSAARFKVIAQLKEIRGTLRVVSRPAGAEVFLNNQSIGVTPLERTDLDPFTDGVLELRKQGHKPRRQPLTWGGKRSLDVAVELEEGRK